VLPNPEVQPQATDESLPDVALDDARSVSSVQRRLWFLREQFPESLAENLPMSWHGVGPLNVEALAHAFNTLVARHEVLRTHVYLHDQEFRLRHATTDAPVLEIVELDDHGTAVAACDEIQRQFFNRRFDFRNQPLLRAQLIRLSLQTFILNVCTHHSAFDGWSSAILNGEISKLYAAPNIEVNRAPKYQYRHFAAWHNDFIKSAEVERQIAYWKNRLTGLAAAPRLHAPRLPAPRLPMSALSASRLATSAPGEPISHHNRPRQSDRSGLLEPNGGSSGVRLENVSQHWPRIIVQPASCC
jgi:hypothetical protein